MSIKNTSKTSRIIENVELAKAEINNSIPEQGYVAPNINNQTHDNKCADTYVTVLPRSKTIITIHIDATDVSNKNILILKQEIMKNVYCASVVSKLLARVSQRYEYF